MTKLEFDDEFSRLMEEFNASAQAVERRRRILAALDPQAGESVLDVGSGPGHQASEIAPVVGASGRVDGVDSSEGAIDIAQRRCADLDNAVFTLGNAYDLPYGDAGFDRAMSSQVFEYLDDVDAALAQMFRVLRPGGRVLIHGTGWGALIWHASDADRMAHMLDVWDGHLADPRMPETIGHRMARAGFRDVAVEPIVHIETRHDPSAMSAIMSKFIAGYAASQGVAESEIEAWAEDLRDLGARDAYFFSSNEYIFTASRPR